MKRAHYANGDDVTLACGCDGCNPSMINGKLCHEHGCPEAWRDYQAICSECGCGFWPSYRHESTCNDCQNPPSESDDCDLVGEG